MKTVSEVSKISGVSIRALHYYDEKGLLPPTEITKAGYRLYDDESLRRLQTILLLRELDFSLEEIRHILDRPDFDTDEALCEQIVLLKMKKERLDRMIRFAEKLKKIGVNTVDFSIFNDKKQKEYEKKAKERWGSTDAYREYEEKRLSENDKKDKGIEMMEIFTEFGKIKHTDPAEEAAQSLVKALQAFITENFYHCTTEILSGLGQMYACEGEMKDNIDRAGGEGTAGFAARAIAVFCAR